MMVNVWALNNDPERYPNPRIFDPDRYKDDFLRAAESQDIPVVDDLEDLSTGHGAEHWLKWINRDVRASSLSVMSPFD